MKSWSDLAETQPLASKIIMNSIKRDRISHAYLLQGQRGTGKASMAILLAKTLFCPYNSDTEPCGECEVCERIDSGNYPDMHWLEPDGQSIRKEQIEYLQKEFSYTGLESDRKVYVVKGAETLTVNASNRLLKFLEEPSQKTTAILLTENSSSILSTIRSRCQLIDFKPLQPEAFQNQLMKQGISQKTAVLLSALTNQLNEAITWSQDDWFADARKLMIQLVDMYGNNSNDVFLFLYQSWLAHFKERTQQELGLDLLLLAFKDILYFHIERKDKMVVMDAHGERVDNLAMIFSQEGLLNILQLVLNAKHKLKQNINPTLVMEQLTIQIQR